MILELVVLEGVRAIETLNVVTAITTEFVPSTL
jgi:hypothetical protein